MELKHKALTERPLPQMVPEDSRLPITEVKEANLESSAERLVRPPTVTPRGRSPDLGMMRPRTVRSGMSRATRT